MKKPPEWAQMSIDDLRKLYSLLHKEIDKRLHERARSNLEARLSPFEPPDNLVTEEDRKRFAGGFFVELVNKNQAKGFFAKKTDGTLFKYEPMKRKWKKMPY